MTDNVLSLVIGEISAWLIILIGRNLALENSGIQILLPYFNYLPVLFPLACLVGMLVARALRKILPVIYQLAKFILVGGLNLLIDMGVLNFLIFMSGIPAGIIQSGFKAVSFLVAVVNSYFWNKHWTFKKEIGEDSKPREFLQFFVVSLVGFAINIAVDYIFVNLISPWDGAALKTWAQLSAVLAAIAGLIWNFFGYKFIVFRTKK